MPELPEVETMRRGIEPIVGSVVEGVENVRCTKRPILISPRLASFRERVTGRRVDRLTRLGKRVAIWLDSGDAVVVEPRMTGLVLLVDPPTREHLRWRMLLNAGPNEAVQYWDRRGLGSVRLFSEKQLAEQYGPHALGPDALEITAEQYRERLAGSRRELKVALLDQRAVAGIGNLYAAEILYLAGIHPRKRCSAMSAAQWRALADATHAVLEEAVRYEGSTLGDGTYRNALNQDGSYQNMHRVYGRAGRRCPRCPDQEIERIVQAQRSTFFCAGCQTRSGSA
ncbi:MAG: bifunctional DNA-formamidopyrimidine glycosylase/DNA-(apurinic or apyrimidinic site) lyase [Planctomycetota bacterium]